MNQPYKHELRSEIAQLREDLFTLIEACKDNELLFPILLRNKWYYVYKMEMEAMEDLYRHAYNEEPQSFRGILDYIQPATI